MATYEQIFNEIFPEKEYYLEENILPITPFLAFGIFRDKTIKGDALAKIGRKLKAKALISKEKAKASLGKSSGGTVYKFTPEQRKTLQEIYDKHGKKIIDEILEFRKEILAPYSLLKRVVKKEGTVSDTEELGMTKSEFERKLESAKSKIENREKILDRIEDKQDRLDGLSVDIEHYRNLREKFKKTGELDRSILSKVYKQFGRGTDAFEDISLDKLNAAYNKMMSNYKRLKQAAAEDDNDKISSLIKSQVRTRRGSFGEAPEDMTDDPAFTKEGKDFSYALSKYMLRREILDELRTQFKDNKNIFVKTYNSILENLVDQSIQRKKQLLQEISKLRKRMEFDEKERKIFEPKKDGPKYSSDLENYEQKIKESDFKGSEHIKQPEELKKAVKDIEAAIKRFERKLKEEIGEEDFKELKEKRLINNLITVKELKSKEELFKSKEEIKKDITGEMEEED